MKHDEHDEGELPFEEETPDDLEARWARKRAGQRRVLLGVGVFLLLGLGLQFLAPLLAPLAIREGPMLQQPTETSAVLVWTQNHDRPTTIRVKTAGGDDVPAVVTGTGRARRVALTGLIPATAYEYTISAGDKRLAGGRFHTAKPRGQAFSFIVFGDTGKATQGQFRIGARIAAESPDFIVHTGDVVYPDGSRDDYYQRFFQPYRTVLRDVALWPSLGNHDVRDYEGEPYREVFDLPANGPAGLPSEHNYWFDYADARFVVIDSNLSEGVLRDTIAPWVAGVFGEPTTPTWRFAVLHHPPYTAGKHRPSEEVARTLVPEFEKAGIAAVFSGHDHLYERSKPLRGGRIVTPQEGIVYIVSGAGGANLYSFQSSESQPAWLAAGRDDVHSYTRITIDGDRLTLVQIDADGRILDETSWTR